MKNDEKLMLHWIEIYQISFFSSTCVCFMSFFVLIISVHCGKRYCARIRYTVVNGQENMCSIRNNVLDSHFDLFHECNQYLIVITNECAQECVAKSLLIIIFIFFHEHSRHFLPILFIGWFWTTESHEPVFCDTQYKLHHRAKHFNVWLTLNSSARSTLTT